MATHKLEVHQNSSNLNKLNKSRGDCKIQGNQFESFINECVESMPPIYIHNFK